jgi:hypothetical protein
MALPGHSRANVSMPAGLLARGSPSASRLLAQTGNGIWLRTRHSQLRGQPRIYPAFPFQPSRATVIYGSRNGRVSASQGKDFLFVNKKKQKNFFLWDMGADAGNAHASPLVIGIENADLCGSGPSWS